MKVASLVSVILEDKDRVIVPGLGAFMPRQFGGSSKSSSNQGVKRDLMFSAFLTLNDGVLVKEVANIENISEGEAKQKVDVFVTYCKEEIAAGRRVFFDNIGWIYQDPSGRLQFEEIDRLEIFQKQIEKEKEEASQKKKDNAQSTNSLATVNSTKVDASVSAATKSKNSSSIGTSVNMQDSTGEKQSAGAVKEVGSMSTKSSFSNSPSSDSKSKQSGTDSSLSSTTNPSVKKTTYSSSSINKNAEKTDIDSSRSQTKGEINHQSNNYSKSPKSASVSSNDPKETADQKQENMESNYTDDLDQEKKKNNSLIIVIIVAIVIVAGGAIYFMSGSASGEEEEEVSFEDSAAALSDSDDATYSLAGDEGSDDDSMAALSDDDSMAALSDDSDSDSDLSNSTLADNEESQPEVEEAAVVEKPVVSKPVETKKPVTSSKPAQTFTNNSSSTGNYFIIAASVKSDAQAQKFASKLRNKGYNPYIVPRNSSGNIRISYGRWVDKATAKKELDRIRQRDNKDAWLIKLNVD